MIQITNNLITLSLRSLGAKIVSLKFKDKEILFVSKNNVLPKAGDIFDQNMAWGWDICAPSVSKCDVRVGTYTMHPGDHGDFWTTNFKIKKQTKNAVTLIGETKEYTLEVSFLIKNKSLLREYKVTNKTKYKLPFTFADHLLLPVTSITLERNSGKMRVEWSYQNKLGQKGDIISWPVKRQKPFADKLFMKGSVAKTKNLTLSSKELKYTGYWETQGGWNNQTNMGLELTNTDRDSLQEATKAGTVWWIAPGKSKKWEILLKVK